MREKPILFSAPMVRAILDGSKTMTRRIMRRQPHDGVDAVSWQPQIVTGMNTPDQAGFAMMRDGIIESYAVICPYGMPGDRLWVRETFWHKEVFHADCLNEYEYCATCEKPDGSVNPVDYNSTEGYWRKMPSIHMPRCASRITLEVTAVRCERLHTITEKDAVAEGVVGVVVDKNGYDLTSENPNRHFMGMRLGFGNLWSKINGRESWDANPWVWVVEFKKVSE